MSEYQYYEFLAIDEQLDKQAMAALRKISSSARITPNSLMNVYSGGDFRGDPDRLMDKYFDAFLYVANWGSRRFMLRMPRKEFNAAAAEKYCVAGTLDMRVLPQHIVLDFQAEHEGGGEFEQGEGWLISLVSLRGDLLTGDMRCLYLAWLAAMQNDEVDAPQEQLPAPPKLGKLSASLQRFAKFMRLDSRTLRRLR